MKPTAKLKPKIPLHKLETDLKNWYVLYCKTNTEKKTALLLNEIGIKAYCPTRTELRHWSDRKKKVEVAVLPSMILVHLKNKDRNTVFQVPTAVRYLYWLKKPAVVQDKEVDALMSVLSGDTSTVEVDNVNVGDKIKLKGLGFEQEEASLKYVSKTHYCVYLERLGYMIKIKR